MTRKGPAPAVDPGVQARAEQMLRHRVQRPGDFHVIVAVHLDPGEDRLVVGFWQRQQIAGLQFGEHFGRHANHLYLQVVGGGDPHSLIRPETIADGLHVAAEQLVGSRTLAELT